MNVPSLFPHGASVAGFLTCWLVFGVVAADAAEENRNTTSTTQSANRDLGEFDIVGKCSREWNEQRNRFEFVVRDRLSNIRYVLMSGPELERQPLVGHTVAIQGENKLRVDRREGWIRPDVIEVIDRPAKPVSSSRNASLRHAPQQTRHQRKQTSKPTARGRATRLQPTPANRWSEPRRQVEFAQFLETLPPLEADSNSQVEELNTESTPKTFVDDLETVYDGPDIRPEFAPQLFDSNSPDFCRNCGDQLTCEACRKQQGSGYWLRGEYLYWWTKGMEVPPIVTTSPMGTAQTEAGILGEAGTQILFGNGEILGDERPGGRLRIGKWLGDRRVVGIEGEYFRLEDDSTTYLAQSDGTTILTVPFFNLNPRDPLNPALFAPAREDAFLIGFPNTIAGSIGIDASTALDSASARLLVDLCQLGAPCKSKHRVDFLVGYRHMTLDDHLNLRAQLSSLNRTNQAFDIRDHFAAENEFNGVEMGAQWQTKWNRISLEMLSKIALGNVNQVVTIDGSTLLTQLGTGTTIHPGGLFAQRTNAGRYERNEFAVIPELGVTIGFNVTEKLRATLGYAFIYWSRVLRAGDQIDREINQDLLAPEAIPFTGPDRPAFAYQATDFWMQGFSVGFDYRW